MTESQGRQLQPVSEQNRQPSAVGPSDDRAAERAQTSRTPGIGSQALLAMQRAQGNQAVQRMVAAQHRRGPASAGGTVQRHPGHNPAIAASGTSERRQHFNEAIRLIKLGLGQLAAARAELVHADAHAPDAGIQGWITWVDEVTARIAEAGVQGAAKKRKAEKVIWQDIKTRFTARGFTAQPMMLEIDNNIALTDATRAAEKIDKYIDRGQALFDTGDFVHAAVHWERAYTMKADNTLAFEIGRSYKAGGDKERAAPWYRKVLLVPEFTARATSELGAMGMPTAPKFTAMKAVDAHYTSITKKNLTKRGAPATSHKAMKESGKAAEEQQTKFLGDSTFGMLKGLISGTIAAGRLAAAEDNLQNSMGVTEVSLHDLILEAARFFISKGTPAITVLADVQRLYPATLPADLSSGGWGQLAGLMTAKVTYLKTTAERDPFKLVQDSGLIKQGTPPGPPTGYDTKDQSTNASGKGYAIFVMNSDGSIYTNTHKVDRFHHSSFLAGAEAAGAGEVKITAGVLREISNKSGHYQPGPEQLVQSVAQFKELGSVSGARLRYHVGPEGKIVSWTGGPDDFVASAADPVVFARRLNEEKAAQGGQFIK